MTATPNTAALQALLDRVEAGDDMIRPKVIVDAFGCRRLTNGWDVIALIKWIMDGTIEAMGAAKALHDAVLPGWAVDRMGIWPSGSSSVSIVGTHIGHDGDRWHNFKDGEADGVSLIPARAWLIAVLRALIAQAAVPEEEK